MLFLNSLPLLLYVRKISYSIEQKHASALLSKVCTISTCIRNTHVHAEWVGDVFVCFSFSLRSFVSISCSVRDSQCERASNKFHLFVRSFVETSHVRLDLVWLETWLDLIWLAWTENAANEWLNESQKCKIRKLFNNAGYSSHTSPLFQSALTLSLFLLMCIM